MLRGYLWSLRPGNPFAKCKRKVFGGDVEGWSSLRYEKRIVIWTQPYLAQSRAPNINRSSSTFASPSSPIIVAASDVPDFSGRVCDFQAEVTSQRTGGRNEGKARKREREREKEKQII